MQATFRQKLGGDLPLIGSFVKTPAPHMVELAGQTGLDFVVLDAEHAPFSAGDLDIGILAGRAAYIDVLVRLPTDAPSLIQRALDLGAAGIIIPHVGSPSAAEAIVSAARFRGGRRGYSNSPRFAAYGGVAFADLLDAADADAAVILQIEDVAGVEAVEAIAAVEGVDALFIGRADLAVAYQTHDMGSRFMDDIAARITRAARGSGVAVATFFPDAAAYAAKTDIGVDMLILGSDQSNLRKGWSDALSDARNTGATLGMGQGARTE